jgi:hypothetical protein
MRWCARQPPQNALTRGGRARQKRRNTPQNALTRRNSAHGIPPNGGLFFSRQRILQKDTGIFFLGKKRGAAREPPQGEAREPLQGDLHRNTEVNFLSLFREISAFFHGFFIKTQLVSAAVFTATRGSGTVARRGAAQSRHNSAVIAPATRGATKRMAGAAQEPPRGSGSVAVLPWLDFMPRAAQLRHNTRQQSQQRAAQQRTNTPQ